MSHTVTANNFAEQVKAIPGGEMLMMCFSCGTCTSKCMIQEKLEPNYNPRRLIREAVFNFEDTAFSDETTWLCTACDLCYPACPQKIHISGVITAVKQLAVAQGRQNPYQTAIVDETTCVACGLCVQVCPYQAITLVEKKCLLEALSLWRLLILVNVWHAGCVMLPAVPPPSALTRILMTTTSSKTFGVGLKVRRCDASKT